MDGGRVIGWWEGYRMGRDRIWWCIMIPMINRLGRSVFLTEGVGWFYRGMGTAYTPGDIEIGNTAWRFCWLLYLHFASRGMVGISGFSTDVIMAWHG
jgi:hypothetical protein